MIDTCVTPQQDDLSACIRSSDKIYLVGLSESRLCGPLAAGKVCVDLTLSCCFWTSYSQRSDL